MNIFLLSRFNNASLQVIFTYFKGLKMKTFIKLLIGLISTLLILVVALTLLINPNDYKSEIQAQVKKSINRNVLINGDISWTFYPQLGFKSGEVVLENPKGFNRTHLVKIDNAMLGIELLPLSSGEIKIGELVINGIDVNLITLKDGKTNLDNMQGNLDTTSVDNDLLQNSPQKAGVTEEKSGDAPFFNIDKAQFAGIQINNTQIEIQNLRTKTAHKTKIEKMHLGAFSLGKKTDLTVITTVMLQEMQADVSLHSQLIIDKKLTQFSLTDLEITALLVGESLPNKKVDIAIKADVAYSLNSKKMNIEQLLLQVDKLQLKGYVSVENAVIPKVRFNLAGNNWDLTPYLTAKNSEAKKSEKAQASTQKPQKKSVNQPVKEVEPDLSFLNDFDVNGSIMLAGLKADSLKLGKVKTKVIIKKGKAQLSQLTLELYEGLLTVNGWVADAKGENKYKISTTLKEVALLPLLKDAGELELVSGVFSFNVQGSGKGLTATRIKNTMRAKGSFSLLNGELYGINVAQEIRSARAQILKETLPTKAQTKKTDFLSLTGQFLVGKGTLNNTRLTINSPMINVNGKGKVNLLNETLDYKLTVIPRDKTTKKMKRYGFDGLAVPLLITGSWFEPQFNLEIKKALKTQLKATLKKKLKEERKKHEEKAKKKIEKESKKLNEKLQDKLNKLFG